MLPAFSFTASPTVFTLDETNRTPYLLSISGASGFELELFRDLLVELGYAGSAGHKLGKRTNPNAGFPDTPGGRVYRATVPLDQRRPIPGFGDLLLAYNGGNWQINGISTFFNFFNHSQFRVPDLGLASPALGRISTVREPRDVQLGLRIVY
jgi:hypothetical protein